MMRNNLENSSAMLESADTSLVSADYAKRNHASLTLEQLNYRRKGQEKQRKSHEKIDKKEHEQADSELEKFLLITGSSANQNELLQTKKNNLDIVNDLSIADQVKNYKEQLSQQGKSQTEILQLLISKFEGNESVSKWLKNWKSFLKLHNFAKTKPPQERKAIQDIISKADFSDEITFNRVRQIWQVKGKYRLSIY